MRVIELAVVLVLNIILEPFASEAQETGKIARIGWLVVSPAPSSSSPNRVAFIQGLRDFGWVEGSNLTIENRSANGSV